MRKANAMIETRGISKILGKTIETMLVIKAKKGPKFQVYFVFTDNTCFEMWSQDSEIEFGGNVYPGGVVGLKCCYGDESRRIIIDTSGSRGANT